MTNTFNPRDQKLFNVIGEVLHYVWDPIGVSGMPQARDEYSGYVGSIYSLLRSGAEGSEISAHLQHLANEHMGLPDRQEQSDAAASLLTSWRDFLAEVGAQLINQADR
jgi:hypothetical protein